MNYKIMKVLWKNNLGSYSWNTIYPINWEFIYAVLFNALKVCFQKHVNFWYTFNFSKEFNAIAFLKFFNVIKLKIIVIIIILLKYIVNNQWKHIGGRYVIEMNYRVRKNIKLH